MNIQHLYFAGGATSTESPTGERQAEGEPTLVWKVLLRTGTWKLRPGPGGQKVDKPLSVYRDRAPKGHISLSEIKKSFDAGAIEYVTAPVLHADGTMDNKGFIRKLAIQDVKGEDGSRKTQSLLWAGFEITEPDAAGMIERGTIPSVSAGVVFDYDRPEDGRKFSQVLVHAMLTHKPWINGTGKFTDKLPEGVFASEGSTEACDAIFGSVSVPEGDDVVIMGFSIELDAAPPADPPEVAKPTRGTVVWSPDKGYQFTRGRVQKAIDEWRRVVLRQRFPSEEYDLPYFSVDDVSRDSDGTGTALICSGYGGDREAWVASFKDTDEGVEIDPFMNWTPAKQEWVAASEQQEPERKPAPGATGPKVIPSTPEESDPLRAAQRRRAEAVGLSTTPPKINGGAMSGINLATLLDGVQLTPEQANAVKLAQNNLDAATERDVRAKQASRDAEVKKYIGTADDEGVLDKIGLSDPGIKAYVRNVLLSDDDEPAIALSEYADNGAKTDPVAKTASDVLKGFIDALPKKDGKVSLSQQARKLPDDPKPNENDPGNRDNTDPKKSADELLAQLSSEGYDLGVKLEATTTTTQGA